MPRILSRVLLCFLLSCDCLCQQPPDAVLVHGKVFGAKPEAQAIAILGTHIIAVGSDASILKMAGKSTVIYDLAGRTVIPGLNDAHFHWGPRPAGVDAKLGSMDP